MPLSCFAHMGLLAAASSRSDEDEGRGRVKQPASFLSGLPLSLVGVLKPCDRSACLKLTSLEAAQSDCAHTPLVGQSKFRACII